MAIDWKTIISEFDGKPTLLQAIGKLRKAVEDETITIQQAQAEIAKLESQLKADETLINTKQDKLNDKSNVTVAWLTANGVIAESVRAGEVSDDEDNIYNFPKKAGTFALTSDVNAVETKAQNALDLATTNETDIGTLDGQVAELETDIGTLDGQVAELETDLNNKQDKITANTDLTAYSLTANSIRSKKELKADGVLETIDSTEYRRFFVSSAGNHTFKIAGKESTSGNSTAILPDSTGHLATEENLKTIFGNQSIVGTGNIDLYRHDIAITFSNADSNDIHVEFISSKNTVCDSLQDLKTVLGDSFRISANGGVFGIFDGLSTEFVAEYMRETGIQTFYKDTGSDFGVKFISFADNPFSLSDTVTTI